VLTGAGGIFSAGMDLKAFAQGEQPVIPGRGFGGLTRAVVRKPLIAAVDGWALGGAFELVLACDLIVAAEDARFGFPEVTRGIVAAEGGLVRLPRRTSSRPECCPARTRKKARGRSSRSVPRSGTPGSASPWGRTSFGR
jgi:enoyl-CoA hydratase/carnithine racemase